MTTSVTSLARRAAAGEVNAREELARIGRGSTPGYNLVDRARAAVSRFGEAFAPPEAQPHPEDSKPELPAGSLEGLKDPKTFAATVLRCCNFKDGSWACAVIVASGPNVNGAQVQRMASGMGMSPTESRCFAHAVRFPDDSACRQLAVGVGPAERRAIVVGQCVGRARVLQAARAGARMAGVHNVIAYEMGER